MELLLNYPGHPNPEQGLNKIFAEYYLMHSAFSWIQEIFDFIKSIFQTVVGFFSSKEVYDF